VNIAFWSSGEGLPVVWIEPPSQLQVERSLFPEQSRSYEAISLVGTTVRCDHRGFGLSDRDISDFSLEALVRDFEAVVDKLALDKFVPMAGSFAGPVAISDAASHPERISKGRPGGRYQL
jgi:pimeloyl-ACP methyl ester carboxylesterase